MAGSMQSSLTQGVEHGKYKLMCVFIVIFACFLTLLFGKYSKIYVPKNWENMLKANRGTLTRLKNICDKSNLNVKWTI